MVPSLVAHGVSQIKKTKCIQWAVIKTDDKGHVLLEPVGLLEITQHTSSFGVRARRPSDLASLIWQAVNRPEHSLGFCYLL